VTTIPETRAIDEDGEDPTAADAETRRRRRGPWIVAGSLVIFAAAATVWLLTRNTADENSTSPVSVSFSEVVIRDLQQIQELSGTLGFDAGEPITSRFSGTLTETVEAGDVVDPGDVLFAVDARPVVLLSGEAPAYRDLAIGDEIVTVAGQLSGPITEIVEAGTVVEQGDVLYRADGAPVVVLYGDSLAYRTLRDASTNLTGSDVKQLETALVELGYDPDGTVTVDEEFTFNTAQMVADWQDDIGAEDDGIVHLGEVVFLPGPALVVDASQLGDTAGANAPVMTLLTGSPLTGTDVEQLESSLAAEGFDPGPVDGTFTTQTQQAVIDWQMAVGMEPDGIVDLGEVAFRPGSVRVSAANVSVGSPVNNGMAVLSTSSERSLVAVDLSARNQNLLAEGDSVTVVLPNDVEAGASVTYVAALATVVGSGPESQATFEVLVELDDDSLAVGFDEAPVDVLVVTDQRLDTLAVPVGSLLALAEGGYAVEVDRGNGETMLVAVDPGMYADGYVEVEAAGLQPGDRVVTAR
jgi:peptidoglycan hydrolase-like protein with peptidoglycan-binding domain/biotin carboxyl carrier protein